MVKTAAAGAGHVSDHTIHHLAALLVGVEVLIKEVAQEAPALRYPYSVNSAHRSHSLGIVFQIGEKVAHRSQSQSHHSGILGHVNQLVDLAGNKTTVEMDEMRVLEVPLVARNLLPGPFARVAHGEHVLRVLGINPGGTFSPRRPQKNVSRG